MNFALVERGVVTDIIFPIDGFELSDRFHCDIVAKCIECPDASIQPGWTYSKNKFAAPIPLKIPEPPVPAEISRRQFFQQAAILKKITNNEALAAVRTGAVPSALQAVIDAQPMDQRFGFEMIISGSESFYRVHPLIDIIAQAIGIDADVFFRNAVVL